MIRAYKINLSLQYFLPEFFDRFSAANRRITDTIYSLFFDVGRIKKQKMRTCLNGYVDVSFLVSLNSIHAFGDAAMNYVDLSSRVFCK